MKLCLMFVATTISSICGDPIVDLWFHSDRVLTDGPNNTGFWSNDAGGLSAYYTSEVYVSGPIKHNVGDVGLYNYALLTQSDITALETPLNDVDWETYFDSVETLDGGGNDVYFTGDQLYDYKYLVLITWNNRNTSLSDHFFELNPIQFNFNVYECVDNNFEYSLFSTIRSSQPALGNVTIIGTNMNECNKDVIADSSYSGEHKLNTISVDKDSCQIEYDTSFKVVYSYNWLVTELNTQIFNVECRQDFTSLVLNTGVSNIDVVVDEIQQIFDNALATQMLIVSDRTDPTSVVTNEELGVEVSLYVSLPSTYRFDFDITVKDCWVDGELVLQDGVSLTPLFGEFDETLKGVSTNRFYLFKSLDNLQSRDILFSCLIETCLNDCSVTTTTEDPEDPEESSFRRRRSIINDEFTISSDHTQQLQNELRAILDLPLNNHNVKRLRQLVSRAQRRVILRK